MFIFSFSCKYWFEVPGDEYIPKPRNPLNEFPFDWLKVDWMDGFLNTLNRLPFENIFWFKLNNMFREGLRIIRKLKSEE